MANELLVDLGANASDWDTQAAGQHGAMVAQGSTGPVVWGGVVPAQGAPLQYFAAGGLTGTLKAGRCVIASSNPAYGAYPLVLPTDVVFTHDAANSTQPRKDLIIGELKLDGTTASFAKFRILKGVASSSALIPTTNWTTPGGAAVDLGVGNWIALATVTIPANATSLSTIFNFSNYALGAGGVNAIPGMFNSWPSDAAGLPPGTAVWDKSAKKLLFVSDSLGFTEPISSGPRRDIAVYVGSVTLNAGEFGLAASTWTRVGTDSYADTATSAGGDFYLPADGGVWDVQAVIYNNDAAGYSGQFRILRSSDDYTLGTVNESGAVGTTSIVALNVYSAIFDRVTLKYLNTSTGARTFQTTVRIARKQYGL